MANSRHQINRLSFDMVYPSETTAKHAHQQIRDAFPKEILPLITEILDELSLEGYVLEYDSITIDLGALNLRFLKQELKAKLRKKLYPKIKKERQKATPSLTDEQPTLHTQSNQKREILTFYLQHGRLPWWANQQGIKLEALLEELLQRQPNQIQQLFSDLGTNELAIKRLTHRFQETLLLKMISIAWGTQLPSLSLFLGQFYKSIPQFLSDTKQQKQAKSYLLMTSLLQLQKGQKGLENQLYQTITAAFFREFPIGQKQENQFLLKLSSSSAGHVKKAFRFQHSDEEILKHFLQYGSIPHWAQIEEQITIVGLWRNVSKSIPIELAAWLKDSSPTVFRRIVFQIPKKEQLQFLAALPKTQKKHIEKALNIKKNKEKITEKDQKVTEMDLLLYFLFEGYLPWWANEVKEQKPRKIFADLLQQRPNYLLAELVGLRQELMVKKRLLAQFDSNTFDLFVEKIEPNLFGFIKTLQLALKQLEKSSILPSTTATQLTSLSQPILLDLLLDNYQKELPATKLLQQWMEKLGEQLQIQMPLFWKALQQLSLAKVVEGQQRFSPLASMAKKEIERLGTEDHSIVNPQEADFERAKKWRATQRELLASLGLRLHKDPQQADFSTFIVEGKAKLGQHDFYNKIALIALENPRGIKRFFQRLIQNPKAKERLAQELGGRSLAVVLSLFAKKESKQILTLFDDLIPILTQILPWTSKAILSFYKAEMLSALLYLDNASSLQITQQIVEAIAQKMGGGMPPLVKKIQAAAIKETGLQFVTITLVEALALNYLAPMEKEKEVHPAAGLAQALGFSLKEKEIHPSASLAQEIIISSKEKESKFNVKKVLHQFEIIGAEKSKIYVREFIKKETKYFQKQLDLSAISVLVDLWKPNLIQQINFVLDDFSPLLKKELSYKKAIVLIDVKNLIISFLKQNKPNRLTPFFILGPLIESVVIKQGLSPVDFAITLEHFIRNKITIQAISMTTSEEIVRYFKQSKIKPIPTLSKEKITIQRDLLLKSLGVNAKFETISSINLIEFHQQVLALRNEFGIVSKVVLREFIQQEKTRNLLADQLEDKTIDLLINLWRQNLSTRTRHSIYSIFIPLKQLLQCGTADLELSYKRGFLQIVAQNENNLSHELVVEKLLELFARQKGISKAKLLRGLQALINNDQAKYPEMIRRLVQQLAQENRVVIVKKPRPKPALSRVRKRKGKVKKAPEEIFIKNAGLVILRPFFGHFFTAMGLNLSKKEAAYRAAHLLQYVAYKTTENAEEDLVLNKLLCGIPLSEPIPPSIEITEKEQLVCEQIIQAATQNWSAMKNTENDNFRVTFLHRSGKLIDRGSEWFLTVERQTFDFLLETIPWGFKMIMMNHMDKMITVEWK